MDNTSFNKKKIQQTIKIKNSQQTYIQLVPMWGKTQRGPITSNFHTVDFTLS